MPSERCLLIPTTVWFQGCFLNSSGQIACVFLIGWEPLNEITSNPDVMWFKGCFWTASDQIALGFSGWLQAQGEELLWDYGKEYCELQYKCHPLSNISIENAERMENCPWKTMILYWKVAIYFAIRGTGRHSQRRMNDPTLCLYWKNVVWVYGSMSLWVYGSVGLWVYGSMSLWV